MSWLTNQRSIIVQYMSNTVLSQIHVSGKSSIYFRWCNICIKSQFMDSTETAYRNLSHLQLQGPSASISRLQSHKSKSHVIETPVRCIKSESMKLMHDISRYSGVKPFVFQVKLSLYLSLLNFESEVSTVGLSSAVAFQYQYFLLHWTSIISSTGFQLKAYHQSTLLQENRTTVLVLWHIWQL